ncbi:MAG: bifunctional metallophosphatase/5'-nucleotidase [Mesoaciditoga sp.]|uniref:5'-nucleotidase C-terminal domain-containing protein n=1 Tax=Athalassotoga sp. TaxID=2022597 RepID=UPI000CAD8D89|nr:MAG: bifunctional metallophosphatase/5'-nucleotidase [Mesoaciditoga sp.]PMP70610.1 MAG: bifunctional metallophosphatase/5'-nucleotidase [Mesoaciditoga sp.]PMP78549.1 MAG: bifunctional metallophosphatase/5'-nucleotidase [Mesoaciditoga sp.]PMP79004.1 MAG: bifunctional metallophosphatase/5'-nucleotidase [Mesoaciditoga sp.]
MKGLAVLLVLLVFLFSIVGAYTLTILETTDLHGHIYPVDYSNNATTNYGLARLATLIQKIKAQNPNVLLFDDGDLIQGSPLEYYHAAIDNAGIDPMIAVMNYLGYDAMTLGNHEFNYGQSVLRKVISEAKFPITSANIVNSETMKPEYGDGYVIFNMKDGPKVGYIALTTKYIPNWEEPSHIKGLDFLDAVQTAQEYVDLLKSQGVDVIIIGYHGGLERNPSNGQPTEELTGENEGYAIATQVKGISALLLGHQHLSYAIKIGNLPVVMASYWGKALGKITLNLNNENGKWVVVSSEATLISANNVTPDATVMKLVQKDEDATQKWLDQPLGQSLGDFYVSNPMYARMRDNPLIQFVNTVQMYYTGARISSTALFNNDIRGWKKGPVTMRDVMAVYIYPNTLNVIEVSGKDLKDALEQSASYFTFDNGKVGVSKMPGYNYDMYEGISYIIDLTKPVGSRIVWLAYDGKPISYSATYDIVLNNYRSGGGGNYMMFKGKPVVKSVMMEVSELMADYIRNNGYICPAVDQNWEVITKPFEDLFQEYVVSDGDTVQSIALKFNTNAQIISGLNALSGEPLPGSTIIVPKM